MFYFYCLKYLIKNLEKFTPINLTNKGFLLFILSTVKWLFLSIYTRNYMHSANI